MAIQLVNAFQKLKAYELLTPIFSFYLFYFSNLSASLSLLVTVHNSYFHLTDQFDHDKLSLSLALVKNPFSLFLDFILSVPSFHPPSYSSRLFPFPLLFGFFIVFKTFF